MMDGDTDSESWLKQRIDSDLLSADLQLSLFITACQSYRHDSLLRPFPPVFINTSGNHGSTNGTASTVHNVKDIQNLRCVVDAVPALNKLDWKHLQKSQTELLTWCLGTEKKFSVATCMLEKQYMEILKASGCVGSALAPSHVFEVKYSVEKEAEWKLLREDYEVLTTFHGTAFQNIHSILHNGLISHLNKDRYNAAQTVKGTRQLHRFVPQPLGKLLVYNTSLQASPPTERITAKTNSLYGEGTYMSSELGVSMTYSPSTCTWLHSVLGHRVSCVTVCEVVNDPLQVICDSKVSQQIKGGAQKSRLEDSLGGDVPEKYYIVQNNKLIRVKYLLIYAEKAHNPKKATRPVFKWLHTHSFMLVMMFYGLLLLLVGAYNSNIGKTLYRKYLRHWI